MKLYRFYGTLTLCRTQSTYAEDENKDHLQTEREKDEVNVTRFPLDHNNLLLKGSVIRNTEYAFGIAVYTGKVCHLRD